MANTNESRNATSARDCEKKAPAVSVIVPVWNPGPGIKRCVESLRKQTLKEIELLFVDDRGTDDAMALVRAAATEDQRIRILTNAENLGSGLSRNAGIEAARGEYLSFVDADDWVIPDFLERLHQKAVAEQAEVVKGQRSILKEGTVVPITAHNDSIREGLREGKPLYLLFNYQHQSALYHRHFLNTRGIRYGTSRNAQDTTFLLRVCNTVTRFAFEDNALYVYEHREGSAIHAFSGERLAGDLAGLKEKFAYLSEHLVDDPHACDYAYRQLLWNLQVQNRAMLFPELQADGEQYLQEIRVAVLALPCAEVLAEKYYEIAALLAHGVNLCVTPYSQQTTTALRAREHLRILTSWKDFATAHPEMIPPHAAGWKLMAWAHRNALAFWRAAVAAGDTNFDTVAYLAEVRHCGKELLACFATGQEGEGKAC